MNITIVGGGNIGTQFAVHCAEKSHRVTIYGGNPKKFQKHLSILDERGTVIHEGEIHKATSSSKEAFSTAELVFITMPAYCMENIAEQVYPYARKGLMIALIPGTGGGECAFKQCVEKGCILFGIQRVPSVARIIEYGKSVSAIGYRENLHLATLENQYAESCAQLVTGIFDIPCVVVPNYLNLTLTPSNPILHTTRLYTLFKNYTEGMAYEYNPLFYEEWNDETSELLFQCDAELQEICKTLDMFDLSYVKSLREHYECQTPQQLTKKIRSIEGFKGLKSPMITKGEKLIPDLESRYFTADFPYGLAILVDIANYAKVKVSTMQKLLSWYMGLVKDEKMFQYRNFGISSLEELIKYYQK